MLLLSACTSAGSYSGSNPPIDTPSVAKDFLGKDVFTVRKITSHYPHRDTNSETTLIVYENGDTGHTKEVLCLFPPDFQLDGDLSTPKLDEMEIPVSIRQARDLFFGRCNENHSCVYQAMASENPTQLLRARTIVQQKVEESNNNETWALAYQLSDEAQQSDFLDKWSLQLVYKGFDDTVYSEEKAVVPELSGVTKVRVGEAAQEYMYGKTGYLCDKVE